MKFVIVFTAVQDEEDNKAVCVGRLNSRSGSDPWKRRNTDDPP
jgi:hypothetical protein